MNRHFLLGSAMLVQLTCCVVYGEPPAAPTVSDLSPEQAKGALLEMMRSKAGQKLGWFDGKIPDEMAKYKVRQSEKGWYHWTRAVEFNPSKAIYTLTISPQSGASLCIFEYRGTFLHKAGKWTASPPEMVRSLRPVSE